jgi:predicted RNase H-like nuclease
MKTIGVDACRGGWFAVSLDSCDAWEIGIFNSIGELWNNCQSDTLILIDIPIGLPEDGKRQCDVEARKILKKSSSSVFPVPCQQAIQADTYKKACRINNKIIGVKLSVQTWNTANKIREVDNLLCKNEKARRCVRESHPEVCFWALANQRPMTHYKKTERGFAERLNLLNKIYPATEKIVNSAMQEFVRKDLARDDILDAIALGISASPGKKYLMTIPENPPRDAMGLPMQIVFCDKNRLLIN